MKIKIVITACICLLASIAIVVAILFVSKNVSGSNFEIRVRANTLTKYVGNNFNVEEYGIEFIPDDKIEKPTYTSSNNSVATISAFNGEIECIGCGTVTITITMKVNEKHKVSKPVKLVVEETKIYPFSVSLALDEVRMSPNSSAYNFLTMQGENVNIVPTVTYQKKLVKYDYLTGEIISYGEVGEDTVTIVIPISDTESTTKTFSVIIEDILYLTEQVSMSAGQTKRISYPAEICQNFSETELVTILIQDHDILKLVENDYSYLIVQATSAGTTNIVVSGGAFVLTITVTVN